MTDSILVFRTSVTENREVKRLRPFLDSLIDIDGRWIFDLEDCDNVLKVVRPKLPSNVVINTLGERGFLCEEL